MRAIFFDLETSDKNPIGQILNYSFIVVDESYSILDELNGTIKISRLQLPSPSAIMANKIDVLEHQRTSTKSEPEAMVEIARFIARHCETPIGLIGYNSSRFDIAYLRTSLIRCGINPYFNRKLIYRDLLHLSRKLSVTSSDFPRLTSNKRDSDEPRVSLSLETLGRHFELLAGAQSHESRQDVLLTIELAKLYANKFKLDVLSYEPYECLGLHKSPRGGRIFESYHPEYSLQSKKTLRSVPVTLLDADYRYSLWIDLERYLGGDGPASIQWASQAQSYFFTDGKELHDQKLKDAATSAINEFQKVNLKNFFAKSVCDIEQDIYRIDFSLLEILAKAIWNGKGAEVKKVDNQDLRSVYLRHQLSAYQWGSESDSAVKERLKKYALYRYGGDLKVDKGGAVLHPTYNQMIEELKRLNSDASATDKALLNSLERFYLESDILKVAGRELLSLSS